MENMQSMEESYIKIKIQSPLATIDESMSDSSDFEDDEDGDKSEEDDVDGVSDPETRYAKENASVSNPRMTMGVRRKLASSNLSLDVTAAQSKMQRELDRTKSVPKSTGITPKSPASASILKFTRSMSALNMMNLSVELNEYQYNSLCRWR